MINTNKKKLSHTDSMVFGCGSLKSGIKCVRDGPADSMAIAGNGGSLSIKHHSRSSDTIT